MGKTGGHKKKSSKTGSQKKILKQYEKEFKATKDTRAKSQEFLDKFSTGEGQVQAIKNAQELLAPILQGQRQEAMSEFDKSTLPQLQAQYGTGGGRSSAFNQALAATRANLENQLFNRSQEFGLNYGSQLAQQQMAAAQQGTQAGLFQGNTAIGTDRYVFAPKSTPVLAQLATGASGGAAQGFSASMGSGTAASGAGAAAPGGTTGATAAQAGQAAAATTAASSRDVKENIKDYDKGLETLQHLEVKNYDYTVDVPGRKENRVGLIAEELPKELAVDIEGLLHADVYALVGLLINCVKQLDQKVKMLEAA